LGITHEVKDIMSRLSYKGFRKISDVLKEIKLN
jgi:hypothetical protein